MSSSQNDGGGTNPKNLSGTERTRLIDFLDKLPDSDLTRVFTRIKGAEQNDTPNLQKAKRVAALMEYIEGVTGPGTVHLAGVVAKLFPKLYSASGTQSGPRTLPPRNPHFTGREEQIESLRETLATGRSAALTQAISGLGGIGKTSLAIEYAYASADQYETLLFVRADSTTSLNSGYKAIALQLGLLEAANDNFEVVTQAVRHYLSTTKPSQAGIISYLLILDNADFGENYTSQDLKRFLPDAPTGHVLLTTRAQNPNVSLPVNKSHVLTLGVMAPDEAMRFLRERVKGEKAALSPAETKAAGELAEELGYLPLALEQASAYIAVQETTFHNYLALYRKFALDHLEEMAPQAENYPATVRTTWHISFAEVEKAAMAAADLLRLSALLAPDAIPMEVVIAAAKEEVKSIAAFFGELDDEDINRGNYDKLLGFLTRYSLVTKDSDKATFSVHRLVQVVQQEALGTEGQKGWTIIVVNILNTAFPSGEFETWPVCERLTTHVRVLAQKIGEGKHRSEAASLLINQAAFYLYGRGRYTEAEPLLVESLSIRREVLPTKHPDIAQGLNNLAALYKTQNRLSEAESLLVEALAIRRDILPTKHPDIAVGLNNLAELYRVQNRLSEAEELLVEALAIRREVLPTKHPDIASSLNNLAELYLVQNRLVEAEPLYLEALAIVRDILPTKHPDIAQGLNNLAALYKTQNRLVEAESLYLEALAIRREVLPAKHPGIAVGLNNLAEVYRVQNRLSEAEPLYLEALEIFRESLGEDHPNTIVVARNLEIFQQEKRQRETSS